MYISLVREWVKVNRKLLSLEMGLGKLILPSLPIYVSGSPGLSLVT